VFFLASPPGEVSASTNGHVSCGIMAWSAQKRQTFFTAIITTMGELLMTCDAIWK
jgi:hypothetical protein